MKFQYKAKNKSGEIKEGEMEAISQGELAECLRREGFWLTEAKKINRGKKKSGSFLNRIFTVPLKNKTIFCRHLAVMIASGLSLSKALTILEQQEKNPTFKKAIGKIAEDVKKGVSFADAMKNHSTVFDAVFVSMVHVGEISGNLEEVLKILADQMEKDHRLISKVRGAMIYPSIILLAMIAIGILMMMFVIPKISGIFEDFGAELPLMTRLIIRVSDFMAANVAVTLGGIFLSVVLLRLFMKTKWGVLIFHKAYLKAPILGKVIIKVNSARFARILSSLLDSGISLVQALKITSDTLGNHYFKEAVSTAASRVQKGINLSEILGTENSVFPYLVIQMIQVGEETGKTPQVLKELAIFYEEEINQVTQNLSSIIEPVLMIIIGTAVGLFAVAIIQPIYSIMDRV